MAVPRLVCPSQVNEVLGKEVSTFSKIWWLFFNDIANFMNAGARSFVGTHDQRIASFAASNYPQGTMYYETDRNSTYNVIEGQWVFISGDYFDVYANRPTDLGLNDQDFVFSSTDRKYTIRWNGTGWTWMYGKYSGVLANLPTPSATEVGLTFYVTDFNHTLVWDGASFQFASGEMSGFIEMFMAPPAPSTGWQKCDGSTATYLHFDGTTRSITLPDLASNPAVPILGNASSATIHAATAPTFTPGTAAFTGTSVTPTGTIGAPAGSVSVPAGVFATASLVTHTHSLTINAITPSGSVALSGGSVAADGTMQNVELRAWFRL